MTDDLQRLIKFFSIEDMPGSNIFYKNLDGTIIRHSSNATVTPQDLHKNLIGKTVFDFYSKESAEQCQELDIKAIKTKNTTVQLINVCLLSGETIPQLIIKKPYFNEKSILSGILVNCIDLSKFNNHASNAIDKYYSTKEQELNIFYCNKLKKFKECLSEILILTDLLELSNQEEQKKLCLELKIVTKSAIKNILLHLEQGLSSMNGEKSF